MVRIIQFSFLFLLTFSLLPAQDVSTFNSQVPNHYFEFSLKLVKETPGFTPPVVSRAFGFAGLTLYEAMVPGMPGRLSTEGTIYGLTNVSNPLATPYHWPTVANNALALIFDSLFANATTINKDSLHAIRDGYNATFQAQVGGAIVTNSQAFGVAIATDIWNYSLTDGGHQGYLANFPGSYVPPVGPGFWRPYGPQVAMQPYWGSHRPFVQDDTIGVIPSAPPAFDSVPTSPFYLDAMQVYNTVNNLTPGQQDIAHYWADGTGTISPPGHSISMLKNILKASSANLEDATMAYAELGVSLSDAFLACWKTKYIYNLCRPITYIRDYIDTAWVSYIGTPPFPECNSGHSSQSGAMAQVMTHLFGTNYSFIDSTNGALYGGPRTFPDFDSAASEAALSRLYGGIHYEFSNSGGLAMGRDVGQNVIDLFESLFVGRNSHLNTVSTLHVYPNPATDQLSIHLSNGQPVSFELLGLRGERVLSREIQGPVDISSISPGVYLLKVKDQKGNFFTTKLNILK